MSIIEPFRTPRPVGYRDPTNPSQMKTFQPKGDPAAKAIAFSTVVMPIVSELAMSATAMPTILTPYGRAVQSLSGEASAARSYAEEGELIYRQGKTDVQEVWNNETREVNAQFWSTTNPASTPNFSEIHGAATGGQYPWVMGGTVKPGMPLITRPSPPLGSNHGGAIEVVVNPASVRIQFFHMPD